MVPLQTSLWGEHPAPEDQFNHGLTRGSLGAEIESAMEKSLTLTRQA